jgi:hypothetical protein
MCFDVDMATAVVRKMVVVAASDVIGGERLGIKSGNAIGRVTRQMMEHL